MSFPSSRSSYCCRMFVLALLVVTIFLGCVCGVMRLARSNFEISLSRPVKPSTQLQSDSRTIQIHHRHTPIMSNTTAESSTVGSIMSSQSESDPVSDSSVVPSLTLQLSSLQTLLTQPDLDQEAYNRTFVHVLKDGQAKGRCQPPYEWETIRHLLALRLQMIYRQFKETETSVDTAAPNNINTNANANAHTNSTTNHSTPPSDDLSWMCAACRQAASSQSSSSSTSTSTSPPHCRRSQFEDESDEEKYRRIMHTLISFYK